jgi:hypothetical protein
MTIAAMLYIELLALRKVLLKFRGPARAKLEGKKNDERKNNQSKAHDV